MTLEVKGVEPSVLSHTVLLYLYQNSLQIFHKRLSPSIISMALTREVEENCKKHQVTVGFLFLLAETGQLPASAGCELVPVVLQLNTTLLI